MKRNGPVKKHEKGLLAIWFFWSAFLAAVIWNARDLSFLPVLLPVPLFSFRLKRCLAPGSLHTWHRLDTAAHLYFLTWLLLMNTCISICMMVWMKTKGIAGFQATGLISTLCLLAAFYHLIWAWS